MLPIILGILTIIITILKWLCFLLLILLFLILALLLVLLLVPVRYHGSGRKTEEKLEAGLSATWLLHLLVVETAIDAGGGSVEVRLFGKTLEAWSALLKKRKEKKHKKKKPPKRKPEVPKTGGKKQNGTVETEKCSQKEPPAQLKQNREIQEKKPAVSAKQEFCKIEQKTHEVKQGTREAKQKTHEAEQESREVKQEEKKAGNQTENQEKKQREEQNADQRQRFSKAGEHFRRFTEGFSEKLSRILLALKKSTGKGVKTAQRIRYAVPKIMKKIRRILHQPSIFLQFWEKYEVGEVLGGVKKEFHTLIGHYRPRRLVGYLKFGTGDPAQTGELTGVLYLLLPTQEYEIIPNFEEAQFETETEASGQIRIIHLLVTAYHLFRNKKLKRLIRRLRKKGE